MRAGRSRRSERGTASVLVIGFVAIVALVVVTVVDASAVYLRRQSLASLADGAALAAADAMVAYTAYTGQPPRVSAARRAAATYLDDTDAASRYPVLNYSVRLREGAVVVTMRAPLELPLAPPGWSGGTVTARSAARSVIG